MRPLHPLAPLAFAALLASSSSAAAQTPVGRPLVQVDQGATGTLSGAAVAVEGLRVAIAYLDGGAAGSQGVFVAVSEDGGVRFGAPVRVDADTSGASKLVQADSCRIQGDRIYVVWRDARNGTANDDLFFNVSDDAGATFGALDQRLDDGAGGANEVFDWRFAVSPDAAGDRLYVLESAEATAAGGREEVYLVASLDGGATWSSGVKVGGNSAGGVDTDALSLAVSGLTVHAVWEDDAGTVSFDDVLYQRSTDGGATFLASPIHLDSTDVGGTGDSASSGTSGLVVRCEGDLVVAAWPEERSDPSNEELRVAVSVDGGVTWAPDRQVGGYAAGTDDVDALDLLLSDGDVLVAWSDDRDGAGFDKLYVARSSDQGASFGEVEASGASGGTVPLLAGADGAVVVGYLTAAGTTESAAAVASLDGGATFGGAVVLSSNASGLDANSARFAYDGASANLVASFLYNGLGAYHVEASGFSLCDTSSASVRNSGANPLSLSADEPVLGATWTASVDLSTTGHAFAAVVGFATPLDFTLAGGQSVLVNPADPMGELLALPVQGGQPASFQGQLPNVPALCGFTLSVQAIHFGGAMPFALSNALDLSVGGV